VLDRPDVSAQLAELGYTTARDNPAAFKVILDSDIDRFAKITREIGLKAD
jgi:tripartite-type tricarboxylate transporter receptor subunit TctC